MLLTCFMFKLKKTRNIIASSLTPVFRFDILFCIMKLQLKYNLKKHNTFTST